MFKSFTEETSTIGVYDLSSKGEVCDSYPISSIKFSEYFSRVATFRYGAEINLVSIQKRGFVTEVYWNDPLGGYRMLFYFQVVLFLQK